MIDYIFKFMDGGERPPLTTEEHAAKWKDETGLDGPSITNCAFAHLDYTRFYAANYPGMKNGATFLRMNGVTVAPTERVILAAPRIAGMVNGTVRRWRALTRLWRIYTWRFRTTPEDRNNGG